MTALLWNIIQLQTSVLAAIIAILILMILWKRILNDEFWVVAVIVTYAITEISAAAIGYYGLHNLWLYNIMLIPQFLLLSHTMLRKMERQTLKIILQTGVMLLILLHLVNILLFQGINTFANYTFIPVCGWLAICSFFYLQEQMEIIEENPFANLVTWLATATLIDNAATMPLLSVLGWPDFIHSENVIRLWSIVTWLYAMWYLIIVIGLLWTKTSLRSVFFSR